MYRGIYTIILTCWLTNLAIAAPPTVTAPEKIYGETNDWVFFNITTDGKGTKIVPLTKGLDFFPSSKLKDPTEYGVKSRTAGTFTLLVYTGSAEGPSEPKYMTVVIGNGGNKDDDPPIIIPPQPTIDPLVKSIKDAIGTNPTEDDWSNVSLLRNCFKDGINYAKDAQLLTNQAIANKFAQKVADTVDGKIPAVRKVISEYMNANLPKPLAPLDQATRDKFVAVYTKIFDALEKSMK